MARILILEDEAPIRYLLKQYIEAEGHQVLEAASVAEARLLLEQQPTAAFLDIDLPGETGVDFLFELRGSTQFARLPVVFATAHVDRSTAIQVTGHGASCILEKPFRRAQVHDALLTILAQ